MARYSNEHKTQTHDKIVKTAARLFRENGYASVGVDTVMKEAGLTSGGFYAHFPSKEALFQEALGEAVKQREALYERPPSLSEEEWLKKVAQKYLSRSHRDGKAEGCPLPSLLSEMSAMSPKAKSMVEAEFLKSLEAIERNIPETKGYSKRERAMATLCLFIGAVGMSRAVERDSLSEEILKTARRWTAPEAYAKKDKRRA